MYDPMSTKDSNHELKVASRAFIALIRKYLDGHQNTEEFRADAEKLLKIYGSRGIVILTGLAAAGFRWSEMIIEATGPDDSHTADHMTHTTAHDLLDYLEDHVSST